MLWLVTSGVEFARFGVKAREHFKPGAALGSLGYAFGSGNGRPSRATYTPEAEVFGVVGNSDADAAAGESSGSASRGAVGGNDNTLGGDVET